MFFYLSKLVSMFLFPLPLFFIVSSIAIYKLPKGRSRRLVALALLSLALLSSKFVSDELMLVLEDQHPYRTQETIPRADVAVVLAGMVNSLTGKKDRPEFISSADRILLAADLLRQGRIDTILISGGTGLISQAGESEAKILRRWLLKQGFRKEQILIEPDSRNTAENAMETAKLAHKQEWKKILLITSAFHMPRSVLCFQKVGMEVIPIPTDYYTLRVFPGPEAFVPTPGGLTLSTMALKEYLGIIAYWLRGYI